MSLVSKVQGLSKRSKLIIVLAVVLVVVACVTGGVVFAQHRAFTLAQDACAAASRDLAQQRKQFDALLMQDTTKQALSVQPDQVADKSTVEHLTQAAKFTVLKAQSCAGDTASLRSATDANAKGARAVVKQLKLVKQHVKAVNDSVSAKQLADAKQALSDSVNAGQSVLQDSDGKVADNATRDGLSKSIDAANSLLQYAKATVQQFADAKSSLDNAVNDVNASVDAKRKADEEAAAKAAAEKAAQQAQQAAPSYNSYGSYSGYSAPRSYATGGTTAPRTTTPSTPAPSAPQVDLGGVAFGVKPGDGSENLPLTDYIYH